MAATYRATTSFLVPIDDDFPVKRIITEGTVVGHKDPLVKRYGHLFEKTDDFVADVEEATAVPGEKRSASMPRKDKDDDDADA